MIALKIILIAITHYIAYCYGTGKHKRDWVKQMIEKEKLQPKAGRK